MDMTLDDLKSMSNVQGRLQQAVHLEYGVSLPVSDLVRRAAMKPEKLQLDKYEKPLYALCFLYKEPFVKDILDEINEDYNSKDSVKRYIANYFKQRGAETPEELKSKMKNAIEALPNAIQAEPTCNNFKLCKYIELTELEDGRYANITDALVGNKDAFVDYGGEMEDLIDDGVPIDMANRIASENTTRKFKLAEALAAPVRMKYQIRDSVEQSIAAGLGEYGDDYLANRAEIRERKEQFKKARMEAKEEQKLEKIKQGKEPRQTGYSGRTSTYGSSYGGYGSSAYGNRGGMFGRRNSGMYGSSYGGYGNRGFGLAPICTIISLVCIMLTIIICLIKGSIFRFGFFVAIAGIVLCVLAHVKKGMQERGWPALSIFGAIFGIGSIILSFM